MKILITFFLQKYNKYQVDGDNDSYEQNYDGIYAEIYDENYYYDAYMHTCKTDLKWVLC